MILRRIGWHQKNHERECSKFESLRDGEDACQSMVQLEFQQFGEGSDKFSMFRIIATWDDVEGLIEPFAKVDHPKAVRLQRSDQLAAAVESLTKN
jgi:hypothetical protein